MGEAAEHGHWSTGGQTSRQFSVLDMPAHTKLKYRQRGQVGRRAYLDGLTPLLSNILLMRPCMWVYITRTRNSRFLHLLYVHPHAQSSRDDLRAKDLREDAETKEREARLAKLQVLALWGI